LLVVVVQPAGLPQKVLHRDPGAVVAVAAYAPGRPALHRILEFDGRVWTVRLASGRVQVRFGEPATAAVSLRAEPKTLSAVLDDPGTLATACADGSVAVVGDLAAIGRLLHAVADPRPAVDPTGTPKERRMIEP
jgi:hypothetical protein